MHNRQYKLHRAYFSVFVLLMYNCTTSSLNNNNTNNERAQFKGANSFLSFLQNKKQPNNFLSENNFYFKICDY